MSQVTVTHIKLGDQAVLAGAGVPIPGWGTLPLKSGVAPMSNTQTVLSGTRAKRMTAVDAETQKAFQLHPVTGLPAIRDTGIHVGLVLERLALWRTVDRIVAAFPELTRADVQNCLWLASRFFKSPQTAWDADGLNEQLEEVLEQAAWESLSDEAWAKSGLD